MLNLKSFIKITQQGNKIYPNRSDTFTFDFVNSVEVVSTWENLADTAEIVMPQKCYVLDKNGKQYSWLGKNIGGKQDTSPIIMRGDKIEISLGYNYFDVTQGVNKRVTEMNLVFSGYISEVKSKKPITIKCMDNMWKLSQTLAPNKVWTGKTIQEVVEELLKPTGLKLNTTISGEKLSTKINPPIQSQNQTIAQVLEMIQRNYKFETFFKGDTLYTGAFRYYTDNVKEHVFRFQDNIISDNLEYVRTDDVVLGIQAQSYEQVAVNTGTRKDGRAKVKTKRLSCFAVWQFGDVVVYDAKPEGWQGEQRSLNLPATTLDELKYLVKKNAYKLIYQGFKGEFTTFGLPFVRHGDNIILRDTILPDRNGTYKAKKNTINFGMNGFRQTIEIDMRVDTLSKDTIDSGI